MTKIFISVLLLIFLCGCHITNSDNQITEVIEVYPKGLDPARNLGYFENRLINAIYDPLVRLDSDFQTVLPGLAERWEVSEDYKTFRFHLKKKIYFHDGTVLSVDDVVCSFQRQISLNPDFPLFNMIESISVIDNRTFEIRLKKIYVPFLYSLTASTGLRVISQEALKKHKDKIGRFPCGTGPLKLKEWNQDDSIIFETFISPLSDKTDIKRVIFKYFENYSNIEEATKKGNIDILSSVPGHIVDRLKWQGFIDYKVSKTRSTVFLGMNTSDKILSDLNIRKAILHAINIPNLVQNILRGNSLVAQGPLPPVFDIGEQSKQEMYHLQKARQLMEIAYQSEPLYLKLFYADYNRYRTTHLEMIERELERINIFLEWIPFPDWDHMSAACRSDSVQLFLLAWEPDMLGDPENFLYSLFYSTSQYNFLHYNNPLVDSLLDRARREIKREGRNVFYREIIRQIIKDTPAVFLYYPISVQAYNRRKIEYLPVDPYDIVQYNEIKLVH